MACLLIRIEGRNVGKLHAYHAGDVVGVFNDTHQFSPAEVGGGVLRVVKIPGLAVDAMKSYVLGNAKTRRSQGFDLSGALGEILKAANGVVTLTRTQAWAMLDLSRDRV